MSNRDKWAAWSFDVTPVQAPAAKVRALYRRLQPLGNDPMLDFDERDLITLAEAAGVADIHLRLEVEITPREFEGFVKGAQQAIEQGAADKECSWRT